MLILRITHELSQLSKLLSHTFRRTHGGSHCADVLTMFYVHRTLIAAFTLFQRELKTASLLIDEGIITWIDLICLDTE
jgi:hypothetical protein